MPPKRKRTLAERVIRKATPWVFVSEWFRTRNFSRLAYGVPAVICFVGMFLGLKNASRATSHQTLGYCLDQAQSARARGDADLAAIFMQKSKRFKNGPADLRFRQALLFENTAETLTVIQSLAPHHQQGYAPARLWLINSLRERMSQLQGDSSPGASNQAQALMSELERQAIQLLQEDPSKSAIALQNLVLVSIARKDGDLTVKYLEQLAPLKPDANLMLAQIFSRRGDAAKTVRTASVAVDHFQERLEDENLSSTESLRLTISLAESLALTDRFDLATQALMKPAALPENVDARKALGNIFFSWSESVDATIEVKTKEDAQALTKKWSLLENALRLIPNDRRVLMRVATVAGNESDVGIQARRLMKQVLATGNAPGIVHLVIGMHAMQQGDEETGMSHLKMAQNVSPNTPVTLNNLAYYLARNDPNKLPSALQLADQAIKLKPDIPQFYDTRGVIHLRLENWTQAISDLERALRENVDNKLVIRESLAKAYAAIGDEELAQIHQRAAAKMRPALKN